MSFVLAASIAGGATLASGALGYKAAGDASDAGAEGAAQAQAFTQAGADRARMDVNNLFPSAQQDFLAGQSGAFDIIGQGMGAQQQMVNQGNMNAQNTTQQGFNQVQNALMGLPVQNYQQPQQVQQQGYQQPQMQQPQSPLQGNTAQQAFMPQGVAQAQAPVNPISGAAVTPLGTQPQGGALGGVFSDIQQDKDARLTDAFSGIQSNRDLLAAIDSGEIEAPGVKTHWFKKMANKGSKKNAKDDIKGFGSSNSLMEDSQKSIQEIDAMLESRKYKGSNKNKYRTMLLEIKRLRGDS